MKTYIFSLALLIIASAISEIKSPQGQLFTEDIQSKLTQSNFGRAFLKLAQLQSKAQQFDFSQLFDALDDLEESIRERIADEQKSFNEDQTSYLTDKAFFENQVTQFTNEIATHEVDIQDLTQSKASLEELLQTKRQELGDSTKLRDGVVKTISSNKETFEAQNSEFNQAISAIDTALELVTKVRDGSFIQKDSVTTASIFLEEKLKSLKQKRVMFAPLVKAFLQVTDPTFADSEMLTKVVRLLQNLRDSLATSKQELQNNYEAEFQELSALLEEHVQRVDSLSNVVIPQLLEDIETKSGELNTKNQLLGDANSNLYAANENLEALEKKWVGRSNQNAKLMEEYSNELSIMSAAGDHLTAAGIRR